MNEEDLMVDDDFKDLLKTSEMTLKKIWDNEIDEIWNDV